MPWQAVGHLWVGTGLLVAGAVAFNQRLEAIGDAQMDRTADRPLPSDLVAFGEVGLGGELRQVAHTPRRLSEAARLGFTRVIAPKNSPAPGDDSIRMIRVGTLPEALAAAGLT